MFTLNSERDVEAKFFPYVFCTILQYTNTNLVFDYPVELFLGRTKQIKKADLVILIQNKPVIVVEAKKPDESIVQWINQVDSYASGLSTKYGVLTNGRHFILRGYFQGNEKITLIDSGIQKLENENWQAVKNIIDIDTVNDEKNQNINEVPPVDKNEISNFRSLFKNLHNEIRDRDKLDPTKSFDELSKILFLKIAELSGTQQSLTIPNIEHFENISIEEGQKYIQRVFSNTIRHVFPEVFDHNERVQLTNSTVKYILAQLGRFKLHDGKEDVKGRAFEEFLPTQLRGKGLGQFFTPRLVVDFMVEFANVSIHDVIVDFSCGSGGFLIKAYDKILADIIKMPDDLWRKLGISKDDFLEDAKKYKLHGIDAEPRAVRIAKMNMLLWGDGDSVVRGNGLDTKDSKGRDYFPKEYNKNESDEYNIATGCTLILANPPFGSKESIEKKKKNESHNDMLQREKKNESISNILSRYILAGGRNSQKTEILFLEKGIKLLRPQGRMFIIIPDSILGSGKNIDEATDLDLILEDYRNAYSNISTIDIQEFVHNIFVNRNVSTGSKGNKIVRGVRNNSHITNIVNVESLENRIDPRYYFFKHCTQNIMTDYVPLEKFIIKSRRRTIWKQTMDRESEYSYISCTNDGLVLTADELHYDNISNQKYTVVEEGDIVYNPARLNIGSIGIVDDEMSGAVVSAAYEVFRLTEDILPELLINILKTPLYRYYLFILAAGSVRDNVDLTTLAKILIPANINSSKAKDLLDSVHTTQEEILVMQEKIKDRKNNILNQTQKFLME